jgi:chromosome partitioning protein
MATIALVGNKGGAGKTTLAVNLASALAKTGSTLICDSDPQGSSLQWRLICENEQAPQVIDTAWDLRQQLEQVGQRHEHVLIDCPPSVNAMQTHEALCAADVALIPVQPSPLDLWATVHMDHSIEQARKVNPKLRALIVVNQLEPRTKLSKLVRQGIDELGMPAAQTAIHRRAIYRSCVLEGKSVFEMGKRAQAAADELQQLIQEVLA